MLPKPANSDGLVGNSSGSRGWFSWSAFLTCLLAGIFFAVVFVAWRLRVDYSDTFVIFNNARCIATLNGEGYEPSRALFLPLLFSPVLAWTGKGLSPEGALIVCHLISAAMFGLLLWALYKLFRLRLAQVPALLGALLFAINPLVLHMAPVSKEDIPATLFTVVAFYFYLRAGASPRTLPLLCSGLFIWAAMATRHNLIPLFFLVIGLHELVSQNTRFGFSGEGFLFLKGKRVNAKILALLLLPLALFLLGPSLVYPLLGRTHWGEGHVKFLAEMQAQFSALPPQGAWQNYVFVAKAVTIPILVCAALGLLASWRNRESGSLLFVFWFGVFFLYQTYFIAYKEARFLLPLFPALYFFVARGLQEGWQLVSARFVLTPQRTIACAALLGVAILLPARQGARELLRFTDPVYLENFEKEVSEAAASLAGRDGKLVWFGPEYPLHPVDYYFDDNDEYTSLYHFHAHVVEFYTGRRVKQAHHPCAMQDGCVAIWNSERATYETRNLPAALLPLEVRRVRLMEFLPARAATVAATTRFEWRAAAQSAPSLIEAVAGERWLNVRGDGIREGNYDLLLWVRGGDRPLKVAAVQPSDGKFEIQLALAKLPASREPLKFALRYFEQTRQFTPPSAPIKK